MLPSKADIQISNSQVKNPQSYATQQVKIPTEFSPENELLMFL